MKRMVDVHFIRMSIQDEHPIRMKSGVYAEIFTVDFQVKINLNSDIGSPIWPMGTVGFRLFLVLF